MPDLGGRWLPTRSPVVETEMARIQGVIYNRAEHSRAEKLLIQGAPAQFQPEVARAQFAGSAEQR